ncbi:MAG: chromosome segregation protein ScpA [Bacteroidetes bacterium]|nr:MAG: chromosome segregation protein ScpA [Bacteroidota bacterium]REK00656.1 MAG: chromosome segregation protein ScpA [Bacteroidota bacterium]REK35222.1 MAG: chromosome segregation protein ScpA [Bacteroidota bacterium]REK48299.1 MAG: chromosome segregation protein ScpA [Bacteroidota bacterium]
MEKVFEIKLPQFEGPFDLLLFFIERDEVDIHNIEISKITNDFLDYIHQMNELNIEVASEFILVAATLMRIKAKLLLPRPEIDEQGNEIDPRKDLIERLLLYKQYKEACEDLRVLEGDREMRTSRGNIQRELAEIALQNSQAEELVNLTLYQVLNTFNKVMKRFETEKNKVHHKVVQYPYTIAEQKESVRSMLRGKERLAFTEVIFSCQNKVQAIFTFLGILELLQEQVLRITLGIGFNNFWLSEN